MKQLYVVEITTEIVVCAESEDEAEEFAQDDLREFDDFSIRAHPMRYWPTHWDDKSIPYGHRDDVSPDRTVKEWMDMGAAPEYKTYQKSK